MSVHIVTEALVCTDCLMASAGLTEHETGHSMEGALSLLEPLGTVVPAGEEGRDEAFSTSPCEGCGSLLAGERYEVSVLAEDEPEPAESSARPVEGPDAAGRMYRWTSVAMLQPGDVVLPFYVDDVAASPSTVTSVERAPLQSTSAEVRSVLRLTFDTMTYPTDYRDETLRLRVLVEDEPERDRWESTREAEREVAALPTYRLSTMAEAMHCPDEESAGARWLRGVRDDAHDVLAQLQDRTGEGVHAAADEAMGWLDFAPTYTSDVWATFTDLGAWFEDVTEYVEQSADMLTRAQVALNLIGERLFRSVIREYAAALDEDNDALAAA